MAHNFVYSAAVLDRHNVNVQKLQKELVSVAIESIHHRHHGATHFGINMFYKNIIYCFHKTKILLTACVAMGNL